MKRHCTGDFGATVHTTHSVILIGGWPPPYGGNSTHIERLAYRLITDGHLVLIADPYTGMYLRPHHIENRSRRKNFVFTLTHRCRLLWRLACTSRRSIIHFHMSAGGSFYRFAPLFLSVTYMAQKRVLTIHSGSWVCEFKALPPRARKRAIRILRAFADIICVNEEQLQVLRNLTSSRLHLIPAYLPAIVSSNTVVPADVQHLKSQVDALLVTSGYGTPIYDYETVIHGAELAQAKLGIRLGLVVATYATWDNSYWNPMAARLQQSSVPTVITRDLDPVTFLKVLSEARIYIRATRTDGDAVSIREAASVGVPVLASDAVHRPQGTALFSQGNANQLAETIQAALRDTKLGRLDATTWHDKYNDIVSVYETDD